MLAFLPAFVLLALAIGLATIPVVTRAPPPKSVAWSDAVGTAQR